MGNNNERPRLPKIQWEKIDTDNGIEIYRNRANNQLAEKRIITLDQEYDIQEQIKVYSMRQHNNDALVRTLGTQNLDEDGKASLLCSAQRKIFVYTQKMPHRLSECPQLTFPQCLLFLREALKGFERIYRDYGPVSVTKQLIGINYLGQIKSWLNENWALNHRGHQYSNISETKISDLTRSQYLSYRGEYMDEQEMVRNIISVIQQKCEQGRFPQAFKQQVQNQSNSFKKLLLYLKDFIDYNDIYVPQRIDYENLLQANYQKRFEYQLNYRSQNKNVPNVANNNYQSNNGQYSFSNANNLNGDLTKYMQEKTQYSNGYQFNSHIDNLKAPISVSDTNKQSPASDALGRVTFSEANRIYTGDNKFANLQWPNKVQGTFSSSNYQVNDNNYGLSNLNNSNKGSNVESKYEFYSSSNYQPPSYQPSTFQSSFQPLKYQSSFNTSNLGNNPAQGSQYSYNYSSSFNGTAGKNDNSTYLSNYAVSPSFLTGSFSNNYTQPTATAYQPSLTPLSTTNSIKQPSIKSNIPPLSAYQAKTYNFEQTILKTKQQNKDPKKEQEFRKIAENCVQIDGKTGQKVVQTIIKPLSARNIGPQTNYQNPELFNYSNKNYGIEKIETITNKWTSSIPGQTIEAYKYASSSSYTQSLPNPSSETISTFSFGSKMHQEPQFGTAYNGTGYSNTLTKYEPSIPLAQNLQIQGKYAEAFSSLLSPSLQQNLSNLNIGIVAPQLTSNNVQTVAQGTPESKPKSESKTPPRSQEQPFNIQQRAQQTQNRVFQGFSNIVERASNQVSQSILKQF